MNIYLLEPTELGSKKITWDCYLGHVVIAKKASEARLLCSYADEGMEVWRDPTLSKCRKIGETKRRKGIVLSSFHAG